MNDGVNQRVCERGRPEIREGEVARDSLRGRGDLRENLRAASGGRMSEAIAKQSQERIEKIEEAETSQIGMMIQKSERRQRGPPQEDQWLERCRRKSDRRKDADQRRGR